MVYCYVCNYDYIYGDCPNCSSWLEELALNNGVCEYMWLYEKCSHDDKTRREMNKLLQTITLYDIHTIDPEDNPENELELMMSITEDVYRIFMHYYGKYVDVSEVYVTMEFDTKFHGKYKFTAHRYSTGIEVSRTV